VSHRIDLRLGKWQEQLANIECVDAVITDPPYTERVVLGYRSGSDVAADGKRGVFNIPYSAISREELHEVCAWSARVARHWVVMFNDHVGARWAEESFRELGLYVFAPLPPEEAHPEGAPGLAPGLLLGLRDQQQRQVHRGPEAAVAHATPGA
jgi:hypothetical protein